MLLYRIDSTNLDEKLNQERFMIEYRGIYVSFTADLAYKKITSVCIDTKSFYSSKELIASSDIFFDENILKYLCWLLGFKDYMVYYNIRCSSLKSHSLYLELKKEIKDIIEL